jgi:sulfoxide reductase heme-binding subunit YedZ
MLKPGTLLVFALSLLPFAWLVYATFTNTLGVNPAETLQVETGIWAFRFLLATLAVTPIRRVTGWNRAIQYRRMLGLFAFFYATLHLFAYVLFDTAFAWDVLVDDLAKRPFIAAGMAAFALMVPLALTSTRGSIRRLGRRWQVLHRLIYPSAIAAALHFVWKVKVPIGEPVYYATIVAALLGFRLIWAMRTRGPGLAFERFSRSKS